MYQLSLSDHNLASFCTGAVRYFVESLEDFESQWKPHVGEGTFQCYERSKSGYYDNDFMAGGGDNDMVICDLGGKFLEQKVLTKEDFAFTIYNGWGCPSEIFAKKCILTLGKLEFQRETYVVAKYRLEGVCGKSRVGNQYPHSELWIFGNPILNLDIQSNVEEYRQTMKNGCWDTSAPMETFAKDTLESFVWLTVEKRESPYVLPPEEREQWEQDWYKLSREQLERIFIDIVGEAG